MLPGENTVGTASKPRKISLSPDEPAGSAARKALAAALDGLTAYYSGVLAGDAEAVHQLRIAIRRLRVTVKLCASVLDSAGLGFLRRELKWLGGTVGALRDCDVIERLIRQRSAKLEPSLSGALPIIYEGISARRRALHELICEMLGSGRYEALVRRIASIPVKKLPLSTTVREMASRMVRPITHDIFRAGARLEPDSESNVSHHLRIRIKRLRYALEMLSGVGGKRTKKAAKRLQDLQEVFGDQHDVVMTVGWLREFAASGAPPEALVTAGALIQSFGKRAHKLAARGYKEWKSLVRSGIIRAALAEIAHQERHPVSHGTQTTVDAA